MLYRILFITTLLITLLSCGNDDGTIELAEVPIRLQFDINAGLNTIEDHFWQLNNVSHSLEQIIEARGIEQEDIVRISPKLVTFRVIDGSDLRFIQEVSIKLFHDNIGRQSEAFWTNQVRFDQESFLDIPGTLIDASDFFDENELNFEIQLDTREINSQRTIIDMEVVFSIRGE